MNAVQPQPVTFGVSVVENPNELAKLYPQLVDDQAKAQSTVGRMIRNLTNTSTAANAYTTVFSHHMVFTKMLEVVKNKIVDSYHPELHLSDKFTVIVSRDSLYDLPQAFALLIKKAAALWEKETVEIHGLTPAFRNFPLPENETAEHRVEGADSSIIEFCKTLGIKEKAKYLHVSTSHSIDFYERHGFKRKYPNACSPLTVPDICVAIPMYLDLELSIGY